MQSGWGLVMKGPTTRAGYRLGLKREDWIVTILKFRDWAFELPITSTLKYDNERLTKHNMKTVLSSKQSSFIWVSTPQEEKYKELIHKNRAGGHIHDIKNIGTIDSEQNRTAICHAWEGKIYTTKQTTLSPLLCEGVGCGWFPLSCLYNGLFSLHLVWIVVFQGGIGWEGRGGEGARGFLRKGLARASLAFKCVIWPLLGHSSKSIWEGKKIFKPHLQMHNLASVRSQLWIHLGKKDSSRLKMFNANTIQTVFHKLIDRNPI